MRTIIRTLFVALTIGLWILAWASLDYAFVIIFLTIIGATWAIKRLLARYGRVLTYILLGGLVAWFIRAMLSEPTFRDLILQLIREVLQLQGARLFVWAVLWTVILGVVSLAHRSPRSEQQ